MSLFFPKLLGVCTARLKTTVLWPVLPLCGVSAGDFSAVRSVLSVRVFRFCGDSDIPHESFFPGRLFLR